jgi:hypothetical protein
VRHGQHLRREGHARVCVLCASLFVCRATAWTHVTCKMPILVCNTPCGMQGSTFVLRPSFYLWSSNATKWVGTFILKEGHIPPCVYEHIYARACVRVCVCVPLQTMRAASAAAPARPASGRALACAIECTSACAASG